MFELTVRQKVAALVLLVFLIIGGMIVFINGKKDVQEYTDDVRVNKLFVYVCGAVAKPGVINIKPGTRKFEVLAKVGGALPEADLNRINLAEFVEDGEQIYLPKKGEVIEIISKKRSSSKTIKETRTSKEKQAVVLKQSKPKLQWPLELNSATKEQLDSVPGIGPFLATQIVEYRNKNGNFQSFEELVKVNGIGPSRLEKLRAYLAVK